MQPLIISSTCGGKQVRVLAPKNMNNTDKANMHLRISRLSAPELVELFIVLQHYFESVSFGGAVWECTRTLTHLVCQLLVTLLMNSTDEIDCTMMGTAIVQDLLLLP
jgi:hypothetical protein